MWNELRVRFTSVKTCVTVVIRPLHFPDKNDSVLLVFFEGNDFVHVEVFRAAIVMASRILGGPITTT